jgi:hypothetical protein
MNFLGNDFIILSLLLLVAIFIFVFLFKDKIFKTSYNSLEGDDFKNEIINYLTTTYPKFKFDFSILDEKSKNEDALTTKYAQVDNLINQYINNRPFSKKLLKPLKTDNLWSEYAFYSKPNKDKLPPDWLKRKKVAYERDNCSCVRCSKSLPMKDCVLHTVTPIEEGGQYYLENLATLCSDCNKILSNKTSSLKIKDDLYEFVK